MLKSDSIHDPLLALGKWLRQRGYRFITVTPATHARVNARAYANEAKSIEDVFGWSRAFRRGVLPPEAMQLLEDAGMLGRRGDLFTSLVRCSSLGDDLFFHSAYPTVEANAVFFGPDTYRFAALIRTVLGRLPKERLRERARIVDIGCGSGAGGIVAARVIAGASLVATDISAKALAFAEVNAALAGIPVELRQCDLFEGLEPADVILANPPYLADSEARTYRDGGGDHGTALSLRIVREGLAALAPGGTLILYAGSPVINGKDVLRDRIAETARGQSFSYEELDPDVFGEELDNPAYADVDRIAAVSVIIQRSG